MITLSRATQHLEGTKQLYASLVMHNITKSSTFHFRPCCRDLSAEMSWLDRVNHMKVSTNIMIWRRDSHGRDCSALRDPAKDHFAVSEERYISIDNGTC